MYTPWGNSDSQKVLAPGILSLSTPSHGGIKVEKELNLLIPSYMRASDGFYEEDADWSIVATVFPQAFNATQKEDAKKIFRNSIPMAYEMYYKEVIPPGMSHAKDELAFRAVHKNDYIGMSAQGDWAPGVPEGQVRVFAGRGGRTESGSFPKDSAYFLVPADEYEDREVYGFVIDEEKHPRTEA